MHILLGLIGLITLLALWYHRIRMISSAARGTYRAAKGVAGRSRKRSETTAGRSALSGVSDPRQAAVIMMMQVARTRGASSDRQDTTIREEIKAHFGATDAEAEDLIANAGWAARRSPPPRNVMEQMSDVVLKSPGIGPKEVDDLCAMLENVAVADGKASTAERDLIQVWRRKAGLN